jgi:hypothetical protein
MRMRLLQGRKEGEAGYPASMPPRVRTLGAAIGLDPFRLKQ